MPKIKTRKTASKRFKTTGTGKLTRRQVNTSHKQTKMSSAHKRRLSGSVDVSAGDGKRVKRMI